MQYENVFKVIGVVHVILAFLKSSPAAQTALKMALHDRNAKTSPQSYTYMQTRENTKKQYNST